MATIALKLTLVTREIDGSITQLMGDVNQAMGSQPYGILTDVGIRGERLSVLVKLLGVESTNQVIVVEEGSDNDRNVVSSSNGSQGRYSSSSHSKVDPEYHISILGKALSPSLLLQYLECFSILHQTLKVAVMD